MRLKEVTLTNFRSYKGVHTFKPQPGASFILGSNNDNGYSSNGGGKTSLLSAIAWVLYGELSTGASKDAVIHYGEAEVGVEVKFEGLLVRRSKRRTKPEVLEFFADEYEGWIREDLAQTQDKLEAYLGVSKELFYNAFWLDNGSKAVQFLFKKPAERLQILQDLLGEGFFSEAKKRTTQRRLEEDKALAVLESKLSSHLEAKSQSSSRIFDLEVEYDKYSKLLEDAKRTKEEAIQTLEEAILDKTLHVEILEAEYTQRVLNKTVKTEDLLRNCILLEEKLSRLGEEIGNVNKGYNAKTCPTCDQPLPEGVLAEAKKKRTLLLRENVRLTNLLSEERKKKDVAVKEDRSLDRMQVTLSSEKSELKILTTELKSLKMNYDKISVEALDKTRSRLEQERKVYQDIEENIEKTKDSIKNSKFLIPMLRFWEEGFGSKGIQNLLLDDVRGLLDQFTTHYLSFFSGDTLKVIYPKGDKGFEILVSYRGQDTAVSNLSRGEVGRTNMAVLLALRRTLLFLKRNKMDFLVLDDAISDLDEAGTQSIVDMTSLLTKEIGNIFVTLPQNLPTIRQDLIIRVEKKEGVSCVS